jgi:hypothetical protein
MIDDTYDDGAVGAEGPLTVMAVWDDEPIDEEEAWAAATYWLYGEEPTEEPCPVKAHRKSYES